MSEPASSPPPSGGAVSDATAREPREPREPRRRKRGLLKMFYGVSETEKPPTDPMDIDGQNFNAPLYVEKMYTMYNLEQLMGREETFSKEIKTLDSDMQTLVYENYNKFISATETIRNMKHQVDSMEQAMADLSKNMEVTNQLSTSVNETLAPRRARIKKLAGGHLMLKKLQFLFELPARLKQCVEMGAFESAVQYYVRAAKVLHHYREMDSFKGIYDECQEIVARLKDTLEARADDPALQQRHVVETYGLLLQLSDNAESLADRFLQRAKDEWEEQRARQDQSFRRYAEDYPKLLAGFEVRKNTAAASKAQSAAGSAAGTEAAVGKKPPAAASGAAAAAAGSATAAAASKSTPKLARRALDEDASFESDNFSLDGSAASGHKSSKADSKSMASVAAADDAAAAAPPEEEQAPLPPPAFFADHGNKVLFLRLAEWIICYQDTFLIGQTPVNKDEDADDEAMVQPVALPNPIRSKETLAALSNKLTELVKELVVGAYLSDVEARFTKAVDGKTTAPDIVQALEILLSGLEKMHSLVPGAEVARAGAEFAVRICRHLTVRYGNRLQNAATEGLQALRKTLHVKLKLDAAPNACPDVEGQAANLSQQLKTEVINALKDLQSVSNASFADIHEFFTTEYPARCVRNSTVRAFLTTVTQRTGPGKSAESLALAGSEAVESWELLSLHRFAHKCATIIFPHVMDTCARMFPVRNRDMRDNDELARNEAVASMKACARSLLQSFVLSAGAVMAEPLLQQVRRDWSAAAQPVGVSDEFQIVLLSLSTMSAVLGMVFGAKTAPSRRNLSSFMNKVQTGVMSTVMKLFSEEIVVFKEVAATRSSVIMALLRIILRALVEAARQATFSTHGLQQMQVDIQFFHDHLGEHVPDENDETIVNSLCGQILTAVYQRCADPHGLSPEAVAALTESSA